MPDPVITNNDLNSPILQNAEFQDDLIKFLGIDTFAAGTILARQKVVLAVANGVADGGNTGNGTVTLATVVAGPIVPLVGGYTLLCTALIANGGVFQLTDPNGAIVATGIITGAATVVEVGGLQFTVTDGATDFAVDDLFVITVVADGDLVVFAIVGAGGAQNPIAILTYSITSTGAEDIPARVGISGSYRKEKLIIDADGDDSNIDDDVKDALRSVGLVPINVTELNIVDNQ